MQKVVVVSDFSLVPLEARACGVYEGREALQVPILFYFCRLGTKRRQGCILFLPVASVYWVVGDKGAGISLNRPPARR